VRGAGRKKRENAVKKKEYSKKANKKMKRVVVFRGCGRGQVAK